MFTSPHSWASRLIQGLAILVATYWIAWGVHHTAWYQDRLYRDLATQPSPARDKAANALAHLGQEKRLLQALQHPKLEVREAARKALDAHWFAAAGEKAARSLLEAEIAINELRWDEALGKLDLLIGEYPDYVEALSRRASLLWSLGRIKESVRDCERALHLNPRHYGVWQGLGLCNLQLGNSTAARRCLEMYLQLQPFDTAAQKWIQRCDELERKERLGKPRQAAEPLI